MGDALLHGSIWLVLAWLVLSGIGAPLPEDAALLATGVLLERGVVHPPLALPLVFMAVLGGDAMLFLLGHRFGPRAYERPRVRKILSIDRRSRIEAAYRRYGGWLIFGARFVAGLRAAVFVMAGMHGMRPSRFFRWDALAACISVPLVIGLGYFGANQVEQLRAGLADARLLALVAVLLAALVYLTHLRLRTGALRCNRRDRRSSAASGHPTP